MVLESPGWSKYDLIVGNKPVEFGKQKARIFTEILSRSDGFILSTCLAPYI